MKNAKLILFLIFILALLLRIGFILFYDNAKMLINEHYAADERSYEQVAVNLLQGKGFVNDAGLYSYRAPAYPLFLAILYFIFGQSLVAVRFVQVIIGALTCLVIYSVGKEVFDERVGLISAFICAIYYPFIQQVGYLITEILFIVLLALSVYYLYCAYNSNYKINFLILSGLSLGISILCRESLIIFPFFVWIWIMLDRRFGFRFKLYRAILLTFFISLVVLPYTIRNYCIYRAFIPVTVGGGHTLYYGNNPLATGGSGGDWLIGQDSFYPQDIENNLLGLEADKVLRNRALIFMRENPRRVLTLSFKKFWNMWRPFYTRTKLISKITMVLSYIPIIILAILGIFLSRKYWPKTMLLCCLIFYFVVVHMISIATIRYRMPLEPYFIIFASFSLTNLITRAKCLRK